MNLTRQRYAAFRVEVAGLSFPLSADFVHLGCAFLLTVLICVASRLSNVVGNYSSSCIFCLMLLISPKRVGKCMDYADRKRAFTKCLAVEIESYDL